MTSSISFLSISTFSPFGVISRPPPNLYLTNILVGNFAPLVYHYRTLVLFKQYVLSPNCGSLFSICQEIASLEKNGLLDCVYDMVHQPTIAKQNGNLETELYF
nr:MAG TPA: hypothetical protein [Caudoviricetes sp.]